VILDGRVVIVIGGGRGVGRAHALACAAEGAKVLVNDLGTDIEGVGADPRVAEEVAAEIRAHGGQAIADASDASGTGGAEPIVERARAAFGGVHAVISAAGLVADRTAMKMDDAILDRMIDLQVRGSFAIVRSAARAMIDQGTGGSIVLHTAPVAFFGVLRQSALAAVGGAVAALVRSAAIELRKHQVRVNAIAPTARTRTTEQLPLFRGIAPDSLGPEFVGPVGAFLASDLATEVSGEIIGAAGTRLYAIRSRETPGWFGDGSPATATAIARAWAEITRA
jgi:NAD(P)-dependent dehydrogenase (short-subunit alcohol dehydrogenase family)